MSSFEIGGVVVIDSSVEWCMPVGFWCLQCFGCVL